MKAEIRLDRCDTALYVISSETSSVSRSTWYFFTKGSCSVVCGTAIMSEHAALRQTFRWLSRKMLSDCDRQSVICVENGRLNPSASKRTEMRAQTGVITYCWANPGISPVVCDVIWKPDTKTSASSRPAYVITLIRWMVLKVSLVYVSYWPGSKSSHLSRMNRLLLPWNTYSVSSCVPMFLVCTRMLSREGGVAATSLVDIT